MGRAFEYRKAGKMARWDRMAKAFTRVGREIAIAVKSGGPLPETNPALRRAVQNAKGVNMPKDRVEAAIKRASAKDSDDYEEVVYEGYANYGIGIVVETATNNPTRTVANIRHIFAKAGGQMGTTGSLSFMFDQTYFAIFRALGVRFLKVLIPLAKSCIEYPPPPRKLPKNKWMKYWS